MAVPTTTPLPIPPNRTSGAGEFTAKADIFYGAMPQFQKDMNTVAGFTEEQRTAAETAKTAAETARNAAAGSATTAGQQATLVQNQVALAAKQVTLAATQAINAAASATAAESAPGSIGNLALLHAVALSF